VIEVVGQEAIIAVLPDSSVACKGCGAAGTCGENGPVKRLRTDRNGLQPGDTVRVRVPAFTGYLSIAVVFILPVLLFSVGIALGGALAGGGARDGTLSIVLGIAGLAIAFAVAWAVNRFLTERYPPVIERLGPTPGENGHGKGKADGAGRSQHV